MWWMPRAAHRLIVPEHAVDPETHLGLPVGRHWACEQPERPGNVLTSWSELCHACLVHLVASVNCTAVLRDPDLRIEWRCRVVDDRVVMVRPVDAIAWAARDQDNPILMSMADTLGGNADRADEALKTATSSVAARA